MHRHPGRVEAEAERTRLLEESRELARRLAVLQTLTAELARLRDVEQVAALALGEGVAELGGHTGSLCLVSAGGDELELVAAVGYPDAVTTAWRRFPLDAPLPASDATRTGQPVFLRSLAERDACYPVPAGRPAVGDEAFAIVPLLVEEGSALGALVIGFAEPREFDERDRHFLQALAGQCAQALERARLHRTEPALVERQSFLAEASRVLASSLDHEATLRRLVELAVPQLADGAAVHVLDGGHLRLVDLAHADPAAEAAMRALSERNRDVADDAHLLEAVRTGRPFVIEQLPHGFYESIAADDEQLRLLRALDARSGVIMPLVARARTLGTLALVMCGGSRAPVHPGRSRLRRGPGRPGGRGHRQRPRAPGPHRAGRLPAALAAAAPAPTDPGRRRGRALPSGGRRHRRR